MFCKILYQMGMSFLTRESGKHLRESKSGHQSSKEVGSLKHALLDDTKYRLITNHQLVASAHELV